MNYTAWNQLTSHDLENVGEMVQLQQFIYSTLIDGKLRWDSYYGTSGFTCLWQIARFTTTILPITRYATTTQSSPRLDGTASMGSGATRNVSSSLDGREGMTVGQQNQRRHEQMTPMGEGFYWNVGTRSQWWSAWTCVRNPIQHSRRYTWMQYRYHLQ